MSASAAIRASVRSLYPGSRAVDPIATLADYLVQELSHRWQAGERPPAEELLDRHPELYGHPEAAIRVVCEEICQREEAGVGVDADDFLHRFPQWQAQLEVLLDCQRLFRPAQSISFPHVGETLGDYRLLAELGRGGQGCVYLAAEGQLADRPVVLKVTSCDGHEHLSLARLQHTHIVPLYAAHDYPARNLRSLVMPYFGGASLEALLAKLQEKPPRQRTGADLLAALDQSQSGNLVRLPERGYARTYLARASYPHALAWIGSCLTDALQYAHDRGLVHLDLKVGNVLLGSDGQPLLLDFHLSREPVEPGGPEPEWFGGTPDYMSPEQRQVGKAITEGAAIPCRVDARSDVYSLGLLLFEALAGKLPDGSTAVAAQLRKHNPAVTVGLADVVARCLAVEPEARYASAAALGSDLTNFRLERRLAGVANRGLRDCWRYWRKENPRFFRRFLLLTFLLAVGLGVGALVWDGMNRQLQQAQHALAEGEDLVQKGAYAEATRALQRGRQLAQELPGQDDLVRNFDRRLEQARRAQLTHEVHGLAEQVRLLFDAESLGPESARNLETACREVWDARADIWERTAGDAEARQQMRLDLLDLAVLGADLRVRLAAASQREPAQREALALLAEAEALCGPSLVLYRERARHAQTLGLEAEARAAAAAAARLPPQTAWEHLALGRSLQRAGQLAEASTAFEHAVHLQPQNFWAQFHFGGCAYRLKKPADAVNAFSVCIALAPARPECFVNRALAYHALGDAERAVQDYSQALQRSKALPVAWLNRGLLHFKQQRYPEAVADLEQSLAHGADPAIGHYNLALVYLAQKDRGRALASVQQALAHNPTHKEARELRDQLQR